MLLLGRLAQREELEKLTLEPSLVGRLFLHADHRARK